MSLGERRRSDFGPAARLPAEIQDLLGIRFFADLPEGPIRDSVEGYLAMPESKRGPNSIARRIVAEAVSRERERARRERPSFEALVESLKAETLDDGATITLPQDTLAGPEPSPEAHTTPSQGTGRPAVGDLSQITSPEPLSGPGAGGSAGKPDGSPVDPGKSRTEPRAGTHEVPADPAEAPAQVIRLEDRSPTRFEFADGPPDASTRGSSLPVHAFGDYQLRHARNELRATSTGWTTGFSELDRHGLRLVPGNLYLVEGPIAAGKTSFLLEIVRRHAVILGQSREQLAPGVFVPGGERLAEVYARLLHHEATALSAGGGRSRDLPSPAIQQWLRSGEALSARDASLMEAAAKRLDGRITQGRIALANRAEAEDHDGDAIAWLTAATDGAERPHSLITIDDLHAWMTPPGPRAGSRRERTSELIASLQGIAAGGRRGRGFAVPIVFSIATELNGHPGAVSMIDPGITAAEVRGIVRLTEGEAKGTARVTLAKNGSGPSGATFLLDLARPGADRHVEAPPPAAAGV